MAKKHNPINNDYEIGQNNIVVKLGPLGPSRATQLANALGRSHEGHIAVLHRKSFRSQKVS